MNKWKKIRNGLSTMQLWLLQDIVKHGVDVEPDRRHARPLLKLGLVKEVELPEYKKTYYVATEQGRKVAVGGKLAVTKEEALKIRKLRIAEARAEAARKEREDVENHAE